MSNCAICDLPPDNIGHDLLIANNGDLDATNIYWHADCYTPEKFEEKVLPKVNAYIESLRIQLAPVMREMVITELVRQEIANNPKILDGGVVALQARVADKFKAMKNLTNEELAGAGGLK